MREGCIRWRLRGTPRGYIHWPLLASPLFAAAATVGHWRCRHRSPALGPARRAPHAVAHSAACADVADAHSSSADARRPLSVVISEPSHLSSPPLSPTLCVPCMYFEKKKLASQTCTGAVAPSRLVNASSSAAGQVVLEKASVSAASRVFISAPPSAPGTGAAAAATAVGAASASASASAFPLTSSDSQTAHLYQHLQLPRLHRLRSLSRQALSVDAARGRTRCPIKCFQRVRASALQRCSRTC
jgi:hypothetical protein